MSQNYDLQKFKQAKVMVRELEKIRELLKAHYKELTRYKKYIPVKQVLNEILSAEIILKLHSEKQECILKSKGEINE